MEQLLSAARAAAEAGAAVAISWQRRLDELVVEEKAASDDLVSEADREAERAIRAVLAEARPEDAILGEEQGAGPGASGIRWLVDPIDGTTSYLYGRADWAVSVAAERQDDGRLLAAAVAEPALGLLSEASAGGGAWSAGRRLRCRTGEDLSRALVEVNLGRRSQRRLAGPLLAELLPRVRDVRRSGSAAAALAQVASGRADAYWGPGLQPWDGAAGALLVSEAGGLAGGPEEAEPAASWPGGGDLLAAAPGLWQPLRQIVAGVYVSRP